MLIPKKMAAVLLNGYGDLDQLQYRTDVPVPTPAQGQVLVRVGGAAINNTDINTRIGWYAKSVETATEDGPSGITASDAEESAWSGQSLRFPRIQGIDVCGTIVGLGDGVPETRLGERVLVVPMQRSGFAEDSRQMWTLGADGDGGYAEYVVTNSIEAIRINSDHSDPELASFPCATSTAENLLEHAKLKSDETVLITGASGGVGSAAIQLARRRGANVIAVASPSKHAMLAELGANQLVSRNDALLDHVKAESVDVVIDVVAGEHWGDLLNALRRGGRYAVAGAIAGPNVSLDVRTLYLKDLTLIGRTLQERALFERIVGYIERGEIRPVVAQTYPLREVHQAQRDFMSKQHVGKLVLVPEHTS